jgi:hypothetical protein
MSQPILVREITQTCLACPSQWEGTTFDGREVYVRLRHGTLRIDINGDTVYSTHAPRGVDGFMTYAELKQLTRHFVVWPEECGQDSLEDEFLIDEA